MGVGTEVTGVASVLVVVATGATAGEISQIAGLLVAFAGAAEAVVVDGCAKATGEMADLTGVTDGVGVGVGVGAGETVFAGDTKMLKRRMAIAAAMESRMNGTEP